MKSTTAEPPKKKRHFCPDGCGDSWSTKYSKGAKQHKEKTCWFNRQDLLSPLKNKNTKANNSPITPGMVAVTKKNSYFLGKDEKHIYKLGAKWKTIPYTNTVSKQFTEHIKNGNCFERIKNGNCKWWKREKDITYRVANRNELDHRT